MLDFVFLTKADGLLMGPISRLLGWILNGIYEFLALFSDKVNGIGMANIAFCIVLFTIIVKMLILPLTIKQQKSTKLSSQMSPELTAINEKYRGKTDEASRRKMQMETQAVYDKYGTNPMAGCLTLFISLPIMFALYRVIYAIPAYINDVYDMYKLAADAIQQIPGYADTLTAFVKDASIGINMKEFGEASSGVLTTPHVIDILSKCNETTWQTLAASFPTIQTDILTYSEPILKVHKFFGGLNILNNPSIKSISVLIPIMSMVFQFLQTKLSVSRSSKDDKDNPAMQSMKMMNVMFPIMSGFICLICPIGVGIYWIISSVVAIIQQFFINRYMDKITVEELIAKNQEKRAKKLKKMGIGSESAMAEYAKYSTKSIDVKTTKDYANIVKNVSENDVTEEKKENTGKTGKTGESSGGSISKYANMLKDRK